MAWEEEGLPGRLVVLQEIPAIAIEVLENRDRAVRLLAWCASELHAGLDIAAIVAPEVVGLQEQEVRNPRSPT